MSTSAILAALRRLTAPPLVPALGVLLMACWLTVLPGSAAASSPATTVSTCDEAGLRAAIAAAAPGDTVSFACGGKITLTAAEGGPIDLEKDLTIDGSGQAVTISGGGSVAIFEVAAGASVTLKGLTIADGAYDAGSGGENGAGGVLDRGALTVVDSTFTENSGNSTGLPTVAGAIYSALGATLEITESTFSKNHASGTLSAGGIYSAGGHVAVTASTFDTNFATYGQAGGIAANRGSLSVTNSTLVGNSAGPSTSGTAGALFVNGFASASVTNSTVTDNSYSCGNCSLDEGAGGIFIPLEGLGGEPVALTNTIVAGNTYSQYATGSIVVNCGPASVISDGGNFADDGTCEGARKASAAELNLGPLADNGGPTRTVALGPGSVAIDAASCLQVTDQRGQPRPGAGSTKCDSGAFEYQGETDTDLALTDVPSDIVVNATSPSGATVTYTAPSAVDEQGDGSSPTVSCTPQSGTTFSIGATTVTCTATDPDDTPSSVSASFSVVVNPAYFLSEVSGSGTYGGTATLTAKLTYGSTAVAGEPLLLALEGGKYAPATTDSNGVATVSGVDLKGIDAGSHPATVEAYYEAVVATGALTVAPADQAITVTSPAPTSAQNGSSFTVAANASSGLPVAYATAGSCTNSGATVTMTAGSGICTVTYTQEGNGNYNAALPASETVDAVALDTTPPTDEPVVTGTKGEDGWYRGDVSVAWHWTDKESGIDKSACTQSSTSTGEGAAVVVSSSCTDLAGNTAIETLTFKIDATKPTIADNGTAQAPTGNDGTRDWYNHDVAVGFSASDSLSGPAEACASPWTVSTTGEGIGVTASSGPCADRAGNVDPGIASGAYNVDMTKPVVSVTGVSDGATYTLGSVPAAGCETTDALSGVKTPATLSISGGEVGTITATCRGASDNAGNTNRASVSYTVAYAFSGFLQPVEDQPICNVAKAGSAIPVIFSLGGYKGLDVIAAEYPKVKPGSCTGSTSGSIEETSTSGKSGLSYDPETDRYTYVWKTDKEWQGQARRLVVVLADGTKHTAEFAFTK